MPDVIADILAGLCAIAAAGIKSLQFKASAVTDFELDRRIQAGDQAAIDERQLRDEWPLHQALQGIIALLLNIVVVALLLAVHGIIVGIIYALVWLLVAELLAARPAIARFVEHTVVRYRPQLFKLVNTLRPALRILAAKQAELPAQAIHFYSKDELQAAIENTPSPLTKQEQAFLGHALRYGGKIVRDVMTPRSAIVSVEPNDTVGPVLLNTLHKSGHSRFPVADKNLDHVVGMLYMHNLVPLKSSIKKVQDAMSAKVYYVHEAKDLDHVLHAFLRTRSHLFVVVNEFEETVGVISIEDILEQIIGRPIVDEFDQYEDLRAVAKLAASARQKSQKNTHV